MTIYKTKSLTPELTDEQIEHTYGLTTFLSFERAIELNRGKEKVCGYKITNEGIIILLES